jgi:hypothetical protein
MHLFGAIRPTNRKFTSPSPSILSSDGLAGADVSRSVSTAIGITPVFSKPRASSSRRLYSESPSASVAASTSEASSSRPRAASRNSAGS